MNGKKGNKAFLGAFVSPLPFWYIKIPWFAFKTSQLPNGGFPDGTVIKNLPANARDTGFDPWVKKIPWSGKWQPTPVFLPGKLLGQRSLVGYGPWATVRGVAKSQTKWLWVHRQLPNEDNGHRNRNPFLQLLQIIKYAFFLSLLAHVKKWLSENKSQEKDFKGKKSKFEIVYSKSRLYWLHQSLWLCGSQQTVENSSRDGNTRPPDLPPEKSVCRSRSNS